MKTITLRKMPIELERRVESKARELGLSLNKTVIHLLEDHLMPEKARPLGGKRHDDLDHLAGSWTPEEAAAFDQALAEQRRIDPEIWE
jgi:hypothetical protein